MADRYFAACGYESTHHDIALYIIIDVTSSSRLAFSTSIHKTSSHTDSPNISCINLLTALVFSFASVSFPAPFFLIAANFLFILSLKSSCATLMSFSICLVIDVLSGLLYTHFLFGYSTSFFLNMSTHWSRISLSNLLKLFCHILSISSISF
jgi:hypothetical protein